MNTRSGCTLACSAIHCRFVYVFVELSVSSSVSVSGSVHATPRFPPAGPDGHGSPPSAVLSGRYDFLLRSSFSLLVRQPAPWLPAHSCPPLRSRRRAGPTTGRGLCRSRWPSPSSDLAHGQEQDLPGSLAPHPVTLRRSTTPDDPSRLAARGAAGAAPRLTTLKASSLQLSRLTATPSSPAVYASRRALPHAMQDSLPAGGLRLCRAGVEPAGRRRKVSDHLVPLPRTSPGASSLSDFGLAFS